MNERARDQSAVAKWRRLLAAALAPDSANWSNLTKAAITLAMVLGSVGANALSYPNGTIQSLYFSGDNNFSVRVVLNGVSNPYGIGASSMARRNGLAYGAVPLVGGGLARVNSNQQQKEFSLATPLA